MKRISSGLLIIILIFTMSIVGCTGNAASDNKDNIQPETDHEETSVIPDTAVEETIPEPPDETPEGESLAVVPEYDGRPVVEINGNIPFFSDDDITTDTFEIYSPLDELGRCGTAFANVSRDTIPKEERGRIGGIKPSGWHTVKYEGIDGNYLYNRCHLIAYSLAGENDNECNLITGTRYLNVISMQPYELKVYEYAKNTGNHVLYRVTPFFNEDELLARGVLMEALSVEDGGSDICFCVFCFNIQPGIEIDYSNGDSEQTEVIYMFGVDDYNQADEINAGERIADAQSDGTDNNSRTETGRLKEEPQKVDVSEERTYIVNTNTRRFHYEWCDSVNDMKEKNKQEYTGDRESLISDGYRPCGRCNP